MAFIRMFTFSYDSLLSIEWPTRVEGRVLPLWRITALRLKLDESVKSRQSRGLWLILSVYIRPSISLQATRSLSILKNELDLRAFNNAQKSLLTVWERSADTCIPSQVTILRIKPHFMYHEKQNQELYSKTIFGFSTLNWRGIDYFGYGYILCVVYYNRSDI